MKGKIITFMLVIVFAVLSLGTIACGKPDEKDNDNSDTKVEGEYKTFGSYPQTDVTDDMGETLSGFQGKLPTGLSSGDWLSYGYYVSGSNENPFMWYKDIVYGETKYRAVYFTGYRPNYTTAEGNENNSFQDDNGYKTGKVYWFRYEPVEWRILQKEDGYATLLCEKIIDCRDYNNAIDNRTIEGKTVYANNYEYSAIRKWLNEEFYNTAFSATEQASIMVTTVKNMEPVHPFACENTKDEVYLLSLQETKDAESGFNTSSLAADFARQKKNTDYAKAQGAYNCADGDYAGSGDWWLRTPNRDSPCSAHYVRYDGYSEYSDNNVNLTYRGVAPVIRIKLDK